MLDAKFVRENLKLVRAALQNRGAEMPLDEYVVKFDTLKSTTQRLDNLRHEKKTISSGGKPDAQIIERSKALGGEIKTLEAEQKELRDWVEDFLLNLPNIPHSSVPIGKSEKDNIVIKKWGQKPIWTPEGELLYDGAGKPVASRFRIFFLRARAFLGV